MDEKIDYGREEAMSKYKKDLKKQLKKAADENPAWPAPPKKEPGLFDDEKTAS